MSKIEKVFLISLFICVWNINSVCAQVSLVPQIINSSTDTLRYCNDSVLVAPLITIQNIEINEDSEGMKVSIVNYKKGEDILVYGGDSKFDPHWNNNNGYLEIKGIGTDAEYQAAVGKVYYKNIANVPNLDARTFTISLLDADYLPSTKHFYRFVKKMDITWKEAKTAAEILSYYGLQGYLTTITSSSENDFIWTKIDGVGWIGGSDEAVEGDWKWVTGPEAGTLFWRGLSNGTRINGEYSFWSSGEPNNVGGGEDFAHINQNPDKEQKSWNDLPNTAGGGYYQAQGFIVEFGEMPGDPEVKLSATAVIEVSKIAFSNQRKDTICEGENIRLNDIYLSPSTDYIYSWTPSQEINNLNIHNPIVSPTATTVYTLLGKWGECETSADFIVKVNPSPVATWVDEKPVCEGASKLLDPGVHTSYLWENLDTTHTITVSDEDWYSVKLTNEFGCFSIDSTHVQWSILPILDYGELDTLVCGSKQQKINLAFENGNASTNLISLNSEAKVVDSNTLSPTINVDEFGIYRFQMEVTDQYHCEFLDTLNIEFHNQPEVKFYLDEEKCKGYYLDLSFTGTTNESAVFTWLSNDSVMASETDLQNIEIPLGYGIRNRTVGLKVNEQGCIDSLKIPVTVIPKMNFWVDENPEGCTPLNVKFDNSDVEDIESYNWEFGDGETASIEKPTHIYTNSGIADVNFDVLLTVVSVEGCKNTGVLNKAVTVHPIPIIDLDFEEYECKNEISIVNYVGSGNENDTYLWNLSDFQANEILKTPGTSAGPFEFKRSSNPIVEIGIQVVSEFGCETDSFSRIFSRKPVFNVEMDKSEGCPPLDIAFNTTALDEIDQIDYRWNFGDENMGTGETVSNKFLKDDKKYDIEIVGKSNITGCSDTLFLAEEVFVYPQPKAIFTPNPPSVLISNPVIQFENKSENATSYEWDFNDNTAFSEKQNPEHRFSEMGFYDVKLLAFNDFGCFDTTMQQVSVAFDKLFPPTAFSPNATREEDREFRVYSKGVADEGYQLLVFNRWGEVIFESQSQQIGWGGKMKNNNFAPAGVYTWVIQYLDFRGEKYKQQGTVTLVF